MEAVFSYLSSSYESFYELVWVFLIYAFAGWVSEVAYSAVTKGVFINRGFLNGAVCPIYGVGVVMVVSVLTPIKQNLVVLMVGSMALTTGVELLVGWLMEKAFHQHWWDYSDQPLNFKGYICLRFSIMWGFACVFVVDIVHPLIRKLIFLIPHTLGVVLEIVLMATFVTDVIITIVAVLKINKHMVILDEIDKRLDYISDKLGENIYDSVTDVKEKAIKAREAADERKAEFLENNSEVVERLKKEREELQAKAQEILSKRNAVAKRLFKAFPAMHSLRNESARLRFAEEFKNRIPRNKIK